MSPSPKLLSAFARLYVPALSLAALACLTLPSPAQLASGPGSALLVSSSLPAPPLPAAPLPDAPGALLPPSPSPIAAPGESSSSLDPAPPAPSGQSLGQRLSRSSTGPASPVDKYINPGQQAPAITAGDKVRLGLRDAISPFAITGWLSSAAYSQAIDSPPNYGQGWGPFAQRFGAAAARGSTEGILSDSVFAPIFHEDPRYYRLGPGHSLLHRTLYSVTRTVLTRTDSGRTSPNLALLAGNAAGSVLTNAYYPQRNRDAATTVETFAGSIGGSAIGFVVSEFLSDALGIVHLK
ncbi:MAG: hypothetical protein NVSMB3_12450 [Acidobacteriaceae bacterium]